MTAAETLAANTVITPETSPAESGKAGDDRMREFRTVAFRETDYRTGCVTSRDVEAPVINRFSDHVLVRLPDGSSLRVQEKRR